MNILLLAEPEDKNYIQHAAKFLMGHRVITVLKPIDNLNIIRQLVKAKEINGIINTRMDVLKHLVGDTSRKKVNVKDYAGSLFKLDNTEIVITEALDHIIKVPIGGHIFQRFVDKILRPYKWFPASQFRWGIANTQEKLDEAKAFLDTCFLIAIDIETKKEQLEITCVSYTGFYWEAGKLCSFSWVLPCTDFRQLRYIRMFNATATSKVFQNGQYDNAYFLRYGAPVTAWLYDTATGMHSWYSEFPKRLDFQAAYMLRDVQYWKHEAKTDNLEEYYRYNARDSWATGNTMLAMLVEAPPWAWNNYVQEFPNWIPCLAAGLEGIKINEERRKAQKAEQLKIAEESLTSLRTMTASPSLNPSSPKQMLNLIHFMGFKQETSSDEKTINKVAFKSAMAARILGKVLDYRGAAKLISTYLDAELMDGKLFYELCPWGTETGRFASKESFFWCGTQIQNSPEYYKLTMEADDGFLWGEVDGEQAESRCTGYESQEMALIDAVESGRDFHSVNVERFFGIPYADIYDDATHEVRKEGKPIRNLGKRVNHGASYNMQEAVLIQTMGYENLERARSLLKLPGGWSYKEIATFLLSRFDLAYPRVRGAWYEEITYAVITTKMLVSSRGWTRYCFGDPSKSKRALNQYVAHVPQNLSVSIINEGFRKVYKKLHVGNTHKFRIKAQIHDSVAFQYREDCEHYVWDVKELMEIPIKVKGRTLLIPMAAKGGARFFAECKSLHQPAKLEVSV